MKVKKAKKKKKKKGKKKKTVRRTRAEAVKEQRERRALRQKFLAKHAKEKKLYEKNSRNVSEKANHNFARCGMDHDHQLIVCLWCDPEHDNPWCGDCHAKRCQSCDKCKGCKETIANCLCGSFPEG